MQRPVLTEWPVWHDDPRTNLHGYRATQRHEIALARFLEKQQAYRASAVRRLDLWAALTRASTLVAGVGRAFFPARRSSGRNGGQANDAMAPINALGLTLSKNQAEFTRMFWGR
ncbi:hypothetical protein [Mesorhizobium sp. WSM4904]|uniref:hypothetical protein n=1 Tax=Mesorhizobium sp. WSM4904 TaxID=3038545 RepID=UPI002418B985|nr:hypothetical protein [Mesorhizobium sp. WSM4904]WFP61578.1 hypothetical protein QAZ47_24325 [Mesorhizobium sp. WSM4904]